MFQHMRYAENASVIRNIARVLFIELLYYFIHILFSLCIIHMEVIYLVPGFSHWIHSNGSLQSFHLCQSKAVSDRQVSKEDIGLVIR